MTRNSGRAAWFHLALAASLFAAPLAAQETTLRVDVKLAIGALSYVEPHALEFGFEIVAKGTLAEGAVLTIDRPAGSGRCMTCNTVFSVSAHGDPCPDCGQYAWLLVGGDEMRVVELEVE